MPCVTAQGDARHSRRGLTGAGQFGDSTGLPTGAGSSGPRASSARAPEFLVQAESLDVLFEDARVHDDDQTGAAGAFRSLRVNDALLHPYAARADSDRRF